MNYQSLITSVLIGCTPLCAAASNSTTAVTDAKAQVTVEKSGTQNLHNNTCLQSLPATARIIVSAAFHEGAGGFRQLKELLDREPWGYVADPAMKEELDKLVKQESPFLIVTMTKKQALELESHRDLIKWILVQSTEQACS